MLIPRLPTYIPHIYILMHEVITLQFGQQANYVGTHYWNTQVGTCTLSNLLRISIRIRTRLPHF
jgi:hypothetical protein